MNAHRQWAQRVLPLLWLLGLLTMGWLGMAYLPQGSPEDYTAYRIAQNGDRANDLWQHYVLELDREREEANRIRPVYTLLMAVWVRYAGVDALELWNALMFALMGLSGWLMQRWLESLGLGLWAALMGAALMVLGAQMEAAQLYLYQEVPALFFASLSLLWLRPYWVPSLLALLLAGATKESYLLLLPAWCALYLWLPGHRPTRRQWAVVAVVLLYLLAMLLYIRATVSTTHAGMYGYSLHKSTPLRMAQALGQLMTQNGYVPLLLLCLALGGCWYQWYLHNTKPSQRTLLLLVVAAYIVLSQVVLYALSGFLFPRYWLPANVALGLLLALGLQQLHWGLALRVPVLLATCVLLSAIGWWHLLRWGHYASTLEATAQQVEALSDRPVLVADCATASYELPWWLLRLQHRQPTVVLLTGTHCTTQHTADLQGTTRYVQLTHHTGPAPAHALIIGSMLGTENAAKLLQKGADSLCHKWNLRYAKLVYVGNPLQYVYPQLPLVCFYWLGPTTHSALPPTSTPTDHD